MSANNYLFVQQVGDEYVLSERDADTNYGHPLKTFSSLRRAINFAEKYQQENIVEYGLSFNIKNAPTEREGGLK